VVFEVYVTEINVILQYLLCAGGWKYLLALSFFGFFCNFPTQAFEVFGNLTLSNHFGFTAEKGEVGVARSFLWATPFPLCSLQQKNIRIYLAALPLWF